MRGRGVWSRAKVDVWCRLYDEVCLHVDDLPEALRITDTMIESNYGRREVALQQLRVSVRELVCYASTPLQWAASQINKEQFTNSPIIKAAAEKSLRLDPANDGASVAHAAVGATRIELVQQ